MEERALAIDHALFGLAQIAIMHRSAEMQLGRPQFGRIDQPGVSTHGVVGIVEQIFGIGGEHTALHQPGAIIILCGNTDTADKIERIGKGRAFDEAGVVGAGKLFQPLKRIMLADGDDQRAVLIIQEGIDHDDRVGGKVHFQLVPEPARHGAVHAQPRAPQFIGKTKAGIAYAGGRTDIAGVQHDAAARLEAPAIAGADLRRALPADLVGGRGHRGAGGHGHGRRGWRGGAWRRAGCGGWGDGGRWRA